MFWVGDDNVLKMTIFGEGFFPARLQLRPFKAYFAVAVSSPSAFLK